MILVGFAGEGLHQRKRGQGALGLAHERAFRFLLSIRALGEGWHEQPDRRGDR